MNGVAFMADGSLLAESYRDGDIFRLTLVDGVETGRTMFASPGGNLDGLALDSAGNVYTTDQSRGRLIRLAPDGTGAMNLMMGVSGIANI